MIHSFSRWQLTAPLALALACLWLALGASPVHAQSGVRVHVVQAGDSLGAIAARYGVAAQDLAAYNGVINPNLLFAGQALEIPGAGISPEALAPAVQSLPGGSGYYTVRGGDTLSEIARHYGMSTADLMRLNGINNPNLVWVGQTLRVSARVDAPAYETVRTPDAFPAEQIHVVVQGDTLAGIAAGYRTTVQQLMVANGLPNPNFVWTGQRLRIPTDQVASGLDVVAAPANGVRWIEIDLTNQSLTAWQGDTAILFTSISSGKSGTPTVTGRYRIGTKYQAQRMIGPGYDLPNVPWVMYFFGSYAIHGAYWHNAFGTPTSHGCVNMRPNEAEMLYQWAAAGTEVYVHY
jgi:LysM repeat protein